MSTEALAWGFAVISWVSILVLGPGAIAVFVWAMLDLQRSRRTKTPEPDRTGQEGRQAAMRPESRGKIEKN